MHESNEFLKNFVGGLAAATEADACLLFRVSGDAALDLEADFRKENMHCGRVLHEQLAVRALRNRRIASATYHGTALDAPGDQVHGQDSVTCLALPVFLKQRVVGILVLQAAVENRNFVRLAARIGEMARESLPMLRVMA